MRITVRDLMVPAAAVAEQTMSVAAARDLMLRWNAEEAYVVDLGGKLPFAALLDHLVTDRAGAASVVAVGNIHGQGEALLDAMSALPFAPEPREALLPNPLDTLLRSA